MENTEALKIIKILADGIDPTTGEVFGEDSPYQHPHIIRALFAAVAAMERIEERRVTSLPQNAGKPWTAEEDNELISSFKRGMNTRELGNKHGRTRGSIQSRLMKHGLIDQKAT